MKLIKKGLVVVASVLIAGTVAAACGGETVTIKFETNGGAVISEVTKNDGETYELPVPQREGYQFDGWFLSADCSGEAVTSVVATENVTYYAKWTKLTLVSLDADGGSLASTEVYLPVGSKLLSGLSEFVPTKSGVEFGGWFNGNVKVNDTVKVGENAINLTARYTVKYTVDVYLQNVYDDEYTLSETLNESDFVGATVTAENTRVGFNAIDHDGEVESIVLSENASENKMRVYFDRKQYTAVFNPNFPDGRESNNYSVTSRYGSEITIPFDLWNTDVEGYCLLGWSSRADGSIEYPTDLSSLIYGNEGGSTEPVKVKIEDCPMLYGVWQKGYTDQFGGDDYIYLFESEEESVVYLDRGGVFFLGEYYDDGTFAFYDYSKDEFGDLILRGKLLSNGKFLYNNGDRVGSRVLYVPGVGVDENVKLRFDSLNGATYTVYDAETGKVVEESTGTYELISDGEYAATFTAGAMAGKTLTFFVGAVRVENGESIPAFQARNEEDLGVGKIIAFGILPAANGSMTIGSASSVFIELDGFGTAKFTSGSSTATYNYVKDEDGRYVLSNAYGTETVVVELVENDGKIGYIMHYPEMKRSFILSEGGTITLDGTYNATYENGDKKFSSYYTVKDMPKGGKMVTVSNKEDGKFVEYKFLIEFYGSENETYVAKSVLPSYEEFYFQDAEGTYYAPMIVFDEKEKGVAFIYGYSRTGKYVKVLEGEYKDNGDGTYSFTRTSFNKDADVIDEPIDLSLVNTVKFAVDTESFAYAVHFWYDLNGEKQFVSSYTCDGATLEIIGQFVFYREKGVTTARKGGYTRNGNVITVSTSGSNKMFFELNESDKTFVELDYAPYTVTLLKPDNSVDESCQIKFDGKGGAIYSSPNGEVSGTVARATEGGIEKTTAYDVAIYKFTSENESFEYITISLNGRNFYLSQSKEFGEGQYVIDGKPGHLSIDGFCYDAEYVMDGDAVKGKYFIKDDALVFINGSKTYYFDHKSDKTVTMRGEEYGFYAVLTNQYTDGIYVELDGYGVVSSFTLEKKGDEYEKVYLPKKGSYEINGDVYTLTYNDGKTDKTVSCKLGKMVILPRTAKITMRFGPA